MKLHLLAIAKNYPKSTSISFCGRAYEGEGPRQPENRTKITTICGKETYFQSSLGRALQDIGCDTSICKTCLENLFQLPEDERSKVLVVVKKSILDKLEDWETKLASDEEISRRIDVRLSNLAIFDLSSVAYFTGFSKEIVKPYLDKLIEKGVLEYKSESRIYRLTQRAEFADKVLEYLREDGTFDDLEF